MDRYWGEGLGVGIGLGTKQTELERTDGVARAAVEWNSGSFIA